MSKFKIGDRVMVTFPTFSTVDVGQVGTVKDVSRAPWILFDTPVNCQRNPQECIGITVDYAEFVPEDCLELVEDARFCSWTDAISSFENGSKVEYLHPDYGWIGVQTAVKCGCRAKGPYRIDGKVYEEADPCDEEAPTAPRVPQAKVEISHELPATHKSRVDLFPPDALQVAGQVLAFGDEKHPDEKWKTMSSGEHIAAAFRHALEHLAYRPSDVESGYPHLAHATVRMAMALQQHMESK